MWKSGSRLWLEVSIRCLRDGQATAGLVCSGPGCGWGAAGAAGGSRGCIPASLLPASVGQPKVLRLHHHLVLVNCFSCSSRWTMYCISLMKLSMFSFVCHSLFLNRLFKTSAYIFIGLFCPLPPPFWVLRVLYIYLGSNPLLVMCFANIFSLFSFS